MKKIRKNIFGKSSFGIFIAVLASILCAVTFMTGCADKEKPNGGDGNNGGDNTPKLSFTVDSVVADIYSSVTLSYINAPSGEARWESSDQSVATVQDGVVTTKGKQGSATVTLSIGTQKDTCTVTVRDSGAAPVLRLDDEKLVLKEGSTFDLNARVFYRGDDVTDKATVSYIVSRGSVLGVDDSGKLTAKKAGESELGISAEVYGKQTGRTVVVTVREPGYLFLSDDGVTFDCCILDENDAPTTFKPTFRVFDEKTNSVVADNTTLNNLKFKARTPIVSVSDDGRVTARRAGTAVVDIEYSTSGGETLTSSFTVNINRKDGGRITPETGDNFIMEVRRDDCLKMPASLFKGDVEHVSYGGERFAATYADGAISLGEYDKKSVLSFNAMMPAQEFTLTTSTHVYTFRADVYGAIIRTLEDLELVRATATIVGGGKSITGYYLLENDLDGAAHPSAVNGKYSLGDQSLWHLNWNDQTGFRGVFDGNGKTVKNVVVGGCGLFGGLGYGAVVKNFDLVNIDVAPTKGFGSGDITGADGSPQKVNYGYACVLAGQILGAQEISNIKIVIDSYQYYENGGATFDDMCGIICGRLFKCASFKNVYIDASALDGVTNVFGVQATVSGLSGVTVKAKNVVSYYWTTDYGLNESERVSTAPDGVKFEEVGD